MGIANRYNKAIFEFHVPDNFKYYSLVDLFKANGDKKVYNVRSMFINTKSQYGDSPVIATDDCLVNVPSHMLSTIKDMLSDVEVVEAVNNSKLGFTIYPYTTKNAKGTFYSITWVDIES